MKIVTATRFDSEELFALRRVWGLLDANPAMLKDVETLSRYQTLMFLKAEIEDAIDRATQGTDAEFWRVLLTSLGDPERVEDLVSGMVASRERDVADLTVALTFFDAALSLTTSPRADDDE